MNTSCTSSNFHMNPFFSTLFPHLASQQQQQQQLLTQLLLSGKINFSFFHLHFFFQSISGATCPPLTNNPLSNALQFLLSNSALFFQQQNFCKFFLFCLQTNLIILFRLFFKALCPIPTLSDNNKIQESLNTESISVCNY
jgi:hypothetical protein